MPYPEGYPMHPGYPAGHAARVSLSWVLLAESLERESNCYHLYLGSPTATAKWAWSISCIATGIPLALLTPQNVEWRSGLRNSAASFMLLQQEAQDGV